MIRYIPFLSLLFSISVFAGDATYIKGPALVESFSTTATAAGTTTLTVSSNTYQQFTGTTTQNVVLPNATTLANGRKFVVMNRSTGVVTVKNNGASTLLAMPADTAMVFQLISNATSNGTWDYTAATSIPSSYLDTDGTLAANSDSKIATQKATKTYVDAAVTGGGKVTGELFMFAGTSCPSGSTAANGTNALRAGGTECGGGSCAALYAAIGCAHGCADGTHFSFPDLRGKFARGYSNGATNDPDKASRTACNTGGNTGDAVGSCQGDVFQGHYHAGYYYNNSAPGGGGGGVLLNSNNTTAATSDMVRAPTTDGTNGTPRTSSETRPINVSVLYCVQY